MPATDVYISGFCNSEKQVREGILSSNADPEHFHRLCRATDKCRCPHHSDLESACELCGAMLSDGTARCSGAEEEACADRMRRRLAANKRAGEYRAMRAASQQGKSAVRSERRGSGVCQHCGCETKGGQFAMGHDAKLKSTLIRAARVGDDEARAELVYRNWLPKDLTAEGVEAQAVKSNIDRIVERRIG